MRQWRRGAVAVLAGLLLGACSSAAPPAGGSTPVAGSVPAAAPVRAGRVVTLPASPLTPDQQILHALNRLGYGPRPGDVERVRRMGLAAYIEAQLDPSDLADPAVAQALPAYPVLTRSAAELVREYPVPSPQVRRQLASGQMTRQAVVQMYPPERRPAVITAQMQAARITRAVLSERQLEEVLVDFWFNHFNVYAQKGAVRWMLPAYEREA
ncbi:MAG TPA: DUF1800 family protein, partial [Methylomirabilota bacterium]|nr:DUF1800 family protein [Methylomirabilota bacterium]